MKKWLILLLAAVCLFAMTGCVCFHDWQEADCVNPRTCLFCEKTEGDPLGHRWQKAACGVPKTCTVCGETEGEALDHDWQDATTDAPRTCARCALTEGERIITDPRFTTDECKDLFGVWSSSVNADGKMLGIDGYSEKIPCEYTLEFRGDGTVIQSIKPQDMEAFSENVVEYSITMVYDNFAATGISRQEADEAMQSIYGMTMEQFVREMIEEMDLESYFGEPTEMVYFVQQGILYMGGSWDGKMDGSAIALSGDTLIINDALYDTNVMTLTRVK